MKRKQYREEKIIAILKEHEAGASVPDLSRRHSVAREHASTAKTKLRRHGRPAQPLPASSLLGILTTLCHGMPRTQKIRRVPQVELLRDRQHRSSVDASAPIVARACWVCYAFLCTDGGQYSSVPRVLFRRSVSFRVHLQPKDMSRTKSVYRVVV